MDDLGPLLTSTPQLPKMTSRDISRLLFLALEPQNALLLPSSVSRTHARRDVAHHSATDIAIQGLIHGCRTGDVFLIDPPAIHVLALLVHQSAYYYSALPRVGTKSVSKEPFTKYPSLKFACP